MEAPLLHRSSDDGDYLPARGLRALWRIFCIESVKMWRIGGPIAFQIVCEFAVESITTIFVGHLGDIELAAFSIALNVISYFSFGFMLGMASALETLCGQAFGAGKVHMLGIYMQRSMIILFASCILMLPLYLFSSPILKLLGQRADIANHVGPYALLTIPQLFSLAVSFPTQKFLQAQSKTSVLFWIAFISLVMHIFLCWLFICKFLWGTTGAAIAFDITNWAAAIAQYVYVVGWCKDGWKGYSWFAFSDLWAFARLSMESAVMQCLEIWYPMSIVILTGHLNNSVIAIGSLSICMNINGWVLMIFIGVNAAISVRVSNELGAGHPRTIKYAVCVTVIQSLLIGNFCMIVVLAMRNYLALIFTDGEDMQQYVTDLSGLLGITMLLDSVQPVISGVAIGGGWQGPVAYINLASYYAFGLPLGYSLGYMADMGVVGLWGGMVAGMAVQTLLLLLMLYRTNWKDEVEKTTERILILGGQDTVNIPS